MPAKLDLVGIVVKDMPGSLAFYRSLGLDIPADRDAEGHVEIVMPGGMRLAWDTEEVIRSFMPGYSPSDGSHAIGLAFLCDSPSEVDSLYQQMTSQGYQGHLEPFDAVWGQRYAQLQDPDGNVIDLFAPLQTGSMPQV